MEDVNSCPYSYRFGRVFDPSKNRLSRIPIVDSCYAEVPPCGVFPQVDDSGKQLNGEVSI